MGNSSNQSEREQKGAGGKDYNIERPSCLDRSFEEKRPTCSKDVGAVVIIESVVEGEYMGERKALDILNLQCSRVVVPPSVIEVTVESRYTVINSYTNYTCR
jgi:hypothetical protein